MKKSTLGAIPPNEQDILKRGGRYMTKKATARTFGQDLMRGEGSKAFKSQSRLSALQKTGNSKPINVSGTLGKSFPSIHPYDEYSPVDGSVSVTGTSIFDPVLCELVYRWFCPLNGKILDPFAGGSVRGLVAAYLGYDYTGVELRAEQVEANQLQDICKDKKPNWIIGDSKDIDTIAKGEYDLIFSCPPYYDLEVYSYQDGELSAIPDYKDFISVYREIISKCVSMLKDNRFACFVVGDIRERKALS